MIIFSLELSLAIRQIMITKFWASFGQVSGEFWASFGWVPGEFQASFGWVSGKFLQVLDEFQMSFGQVSEFEKSKECSIFPFLAYTLTAMYFLFTIAM